MLRCINCHLNINRMLRHAVSSLESTMRTLLSTWTTLQQLPPEAVICQRCFLQLGAHCRNENMNAERELGHTHVCVGCGRSLLETRRHVRCHILEANHPLITIILSWDSQNEVISRDAIACHLCWMRANRLLSHDALRLQADTDHYAENENQHAILSNCQHLKKQGQREVLATNSTTISNSRSTGSSSI